MAVRERKLKRVVIKVGTSSLTEGFKLSGSKVNKVVAEAMKLREHGIEVLIVSSGAIAAGVGELGLTQKPRDLKMLQAVAAVGQNELMKAYSKSFGKQGQKVAQVLLTKKNFSDRRSYLNIKNTLSTLLKAGIIPVINENDSVSVEEIISGDNDNLAATVAVNLNADALIMLSDSGFKMKLRDKKTVPVIPQITIEIKNAAKGGRSRGKGGMATKLQAAEKTMNANVDLFIVDAKKRGAVSGVLFNPTKRMLVLKNATLFPCHRKLTDRQHWMLYSSKPAGKIMVDDGAKQAILKKGSSLLPAGILAVVDTFTAGDVVIIADKNTREIGRGISNFSSQEITKIMGKQSREIEKLLGRKCKCEVVYRGNMVVK